MIHKTVTLDTLKTISSINSPVTITESSSGAMLFCEKGARLLGLFPDRRKTNVLWVPDHLEVAMTEGSWMVGGERLWIAPERSFFYENTRDFEGFLVPADMDPGNYAASDDLTFENNFSILDFQHNYTYDQCTARRRFTPVDDPFSTGLAYAGVQVEDSMRLNGDTLPFCAWSLAMVYTPGPLHPGTAFFPVKPNGKFISYFRPIPGDRAEIREGYARFKIDAADIYKFALNPEDTVTENPIKCVYMAPFPADPYWFCVVKKTAEKLAQSQDECVDPAKGNPDGPRGAIQAYNSGPDVEGVAPPFGEIELQLPRAQPVEGGAESRGTHELLSYCGPKQDVLDLVQNLLGCDDAPALY